MDFEDQYRNGIRSASGGRYASASSNSRPSLMHDNRGAVILWSETIRKEARGLEAFDLGEVRAVGPDHVKTQKGVLRRETFYLPIELAEAFDGVTLWFRIAPEDAEEFKGRSGQSRDANQLSVNLGWGDLGRIELARVLVIAARIR